MINIPNETKQWKTGLNSDLFGNIAVTKNISFDNEGYLELAGSSRVIQTELIDADVDRASVILKDQSGYFVNTWDDPYTVDYQPLAVAPTKITEADAPRGDIQSDAVWYGGKLIVSDRSNVVFRVEAEGGAWTDTNVSLTDTSQGQHPVKVFPSQNAWCVADIYTVKMYTDISATPTLAVTLTIPTDYKITSMTYFNQYMFIATKHNYGGKAAMYVWDGSSTSASQVYEIDSHIIHDIVVYSDSIVLLSGSGALLRFNGAGFDMLDAFPVFYTPYTLSDLTNINHYKNILKSNSDVLYINFSYNNVSNVFLNQPAGVWCYEPKVGLYHKYAFTLNNVIRNTLTTANVNITTDEITVTASPITGTACVFKAFGTAIGGLVDEGVYYVIKVNATTIKLATSYANAIAGTAIDLTGTGTTGQSIVFFPDIDFGAFRANRPAAILPITTTSSIWGADVLWSADVISRGSTTDYGTLGTVTQFIDARGYFVTPKVFSNEVTDTFKLLTLKYAPLSGTDKILIKYRVLDDGITTIDASGTNWRITWTSVNTFTTTYSEWANAQVGDEIEVLQHAGAGLLAHITSITSVGGTYTITIDENFDNYLTGDIGLAIFRNWIKLATIDATNTDGFISRNIDAKGKFIQVKVELRGKKVKIEELKIDNKYLLPASR
jgi:hypothetical protein